jgi:hypothetical protein
MRRILLALGLLASGCAQLGIPHGDATAELVAAGAQVARQPEAVQRRAIAQAGAAFARDASDANRARLAILLVAVPAPLRDDGRAAELLRPLASADADRPLARLAVLLTGQIAERQRLAREAERREQASRERESALRAQLEALRAVERRMIEREERAGSVRR